MGDCYSSNRAASSAGRKASLDQGISNIIDNGVVLEVLVLWIMDMEIILLLWSTSTTNLHHILGQQPLLASSLGDVTATVSRITCNNTALIPRQLLLLLVHHLLHDDSSGGRAKNQLESVSFVITEGPANSLLQEEQESPDSDQLLSRGNLTFRPIDYKNG